LLAISSPRLVKETERVGLAISLSASHGPAPPTHGPVALPLMPHTPSRATAPCSRARAPLYIRCPPPALALLRQGPPLVLLRRCSPPLPCRPSDAPLLSRARATAILSHARTTPVPCCHLAIDRSIPRGPARAPSSSLEQRFTGGARAT
jgi:hypothetical protein